MRPGAAESERRAVSSVPCLSRAEAEALIVELAAVVAAGDDRFRELYGREPDLHDPLMLPNGDAARIASDAIAVVAQGLVDAGVTPEIVHAFDRTGMLVSEEELQRWTAAVAGCRAPVA